MSSAPAVQARLDALRQALRRRHGWTHLEVTARADTEARRVELRGEVAVARLRPRVLAAARQAAPGWAVEGRDLRVMAGGTWHALLAPTTLWAACPGSEPEPGRGPGRWPGSGPVSGSHLATELWPQDGPVQRLGAAHGAVVVRGRDGTVGWLREPLGPEVAPPVLAVPHGDDPVALVEAARPWIGTPYRLGGVTPEGVDCSALVQRLAARILGVLVPRHSSDQLQIAPRPGEGRGTGDLSFVWSDREALCHVGIATGPSGGPTGGPTVVHASLSRRRVVEDTAEDFLAGSRRVMHVPFAALLAFGRRVAGAPSLTAAGFELGREVAAEPAPASEPL